MNGDISRKLNLTHANKPGLNQ